MATTELRCTRHHTPTHLACAQCEKPSCPRCLVWTEVGQKCRTCAYPRGDPSRRRLSQLVVPGLLLAGLLVALGVGLGLFSDDSGSDVPVAGNTGPRQATIGQPARDGPLTFVVTGFDCPGKEVGDGPVKRTALGRFCVLQFKAANTASRPAFFSFPAQVLLDHQKRRFEPDPLATGIHQRTLSPQGVGPPTQRLNPGAEISSSLVYDIPEGVTPEVAELHAGRSIGVTVRLRPPAPPA